MNENEILLMRHSFKQITATLHLSYQDIVRIRCIDLMSSPKSHFPCLSFKKIDYKTSNMTTNGITLFACEIHSVMPPPLVE